MAETLLRKAHELASQKRKPLSVLQVSIDGFDAVSQEAAATVARLVADLIRDEIDYGDTVARVEDDRFLAVLSGRPIGEARALAERLCLAVRKLGLPIAEGTSLALSVGVSQVLMGERSAQQAVDRASKALGKARQYGGNQVQAVAGGLG
jgi:diguanylate cyclase (GGDEF)-like protein